MDNKQEKRKEFNEKLVESDELFSLFMKHSPIYAYIKKVMPSKSLVLRASENFIDMIGTSGSDMEGKSMEELFPPEFAAKITEDDWKVVSSGEVLILDEELNGRYYTTYKFPIFQGGRYLLAGYTVDITQRKLAEDEVNEKAKELERFNNLLVDRELKMIELKAEINDLLAGMGKPEKYKIVK